MRQRRPVRLRHSAYAAGVSLIEVLVTLIIVSVGLLGTAALQLSTLRNNYNALTRSHAAVLAADILDRMRANLEAARAGNYVVTMGAYSDSATPAQQDILTWKRVLAAQLAGGDGAISTVTTDPSGDAQVVQITIQWAERVEGEEQGAPATLTFQTRSRI